MNRALLTFGKGNRKVGDAVYTFSLPAGWTCPGAMDCLARADRQTGKVTDSAGQKFRCFSVSMEARHSTVRNARWRNFELLRAAKTTRAMADLILESLPAKARIVRIHVGGDFYSRAYLDAWILAATQRPDVVFYGYTKSVHLFTENRAARPWDLPSNLRITASVGGRHDVLIGRTWLNRARVVYSEQEADALGLEIDHDDSHAIAAKEDFALLIHGIQPKGSAAAEALKKIQQRERDEAYGFETLELRKAEALQRLRWRG